MKPYTTASFVPLTHVAQMNRRRYKKVMRAMVKRRMRYDFHRNGWVDEDSTWQVCEQAGFHWTEIKIPIYGKATVLRSQGLLSAAPASPASDSRTAADPSKTGAA